jgi:uncharacterized protein YndB with AHSA1/START domain
VTVTAPDAITKRIHVEAPPAAAFRTFTERIGDWWPLERYSVFGGEATVAFEGDRIVERLGDRETVWGEVLEVEAAARIRFTWHPGREGEEATEVEVAFVADGDGTSVTLVHSGWERLSDERRAGRVDYEKGWPRVLEGYARLATSSTE